MKYRVGLILLLWSAGLMQNCKKSELAETKTGITQEDAEFIIQTEKIADDLFSFVDVNAFNVNIKQDEPPKKDLPPCIKQNLIIHSPTYYTITYTFAINSCELENGNVYSGTIVLERYFDKDLLSFSGNLLLKDFYVNGIKLEGNASFKHQINPGALPQTDYEYELTFRFPNGDVAKQEGERKRIWESGFLTSDWLDNTFLVSGEAYILKRNGVKIDIRSQTPLKKNFICPYYSSGLLHIEKGEDEAILDFGDGKCDNQVKLIYENGKTTIIQLKI